MMLREKKKGLEKKKNREAFLLRSEGGEEGGALGGSGEGGLCLSKRNREELLEGDKEKLGVEGQEVLGDSG